MNKCFHVYKIENVINGKVYIGKTSGNPRQRWTRHIKIATGGGSYNRYKKYAIHLAIAKYGVDKFNFSVLESFHDENIAYMKEIEYISEYDSVRNGYNLSLGGKSGGSGSESCVALFNTEDIRHIFDKFADGMKPIQIAKIYNCTKTTIYDILDRITYCSVDVNDSVIEHVNSLRMKNKKVNAKSLDINIICALYKSGLSYRQLAKKFSSSTFTIQKIIRHNVHQSEIDKNKIKKISDEFGNKIISEYLNSNLNAAELGSKYNVSKHVVYDIIKGKTFDVSENLRCRLRLVSRQKSAGSTKKKLEE